MVQPDIYFGPHPGSLIYRKLSAGASTKTSSQCQDPLEYLGNSDNEDYYSEDDEYNYRSEDTDTDTDSESDHDPVFNYELVEK